MDVLAGMSAFTYFSSQSHQTDQGNSERATPTQSSSGRSRSRNPTRPTRAIPREQQLTLTIYPRLSQSHQTDQGNSEIYGESPAWVALEESQSHRTDQGNPEGHDPVGGVVRVHLQVAIPPD